MDIDPPALIKGILARPFNTSFTRQINTARSLYGKQLYMPALTRKDIEKQLEVLLEYYSIRDRGIISDRVVESIIARQKFNR